MAMSKRDWASALAERASDLQTVLAFATRLPLPDTVPHAPLVRALRMLPMAGAIIGAASALFYVLGSAIGLQSPLAAAAALGFQAWLTRGLHEDGLADFADGIGGGSSRERKLAIMRDSRIGTYGACALAVSLMLRWSAVAAIEHPAPAAAALIAAHAAARGALPSFMRLVPLARADGLAAGAAGVSWENGSVAALLGLIALAAAFGPRTAAVAFVLLLVAALLMARLCIQQVGGQTGDVIGALEQVNEILILMTAAIVFGPLS